MKRENCTGGHCHHSFSLSQAALCVINYKACIRNNAKKAKSLITLNLTFPWKMISLLQLKHPTKPNRSIKAYNKLFEVLIIYNHRFSKFISNCISLAYCTLHKLENIHFHYIVTDVRQCSLSNATDLDYQTTFLEAARKWCKKKSSQPVLHFSTSCVCYFLSWLLACSFSSSPVLHMLLGAVS